MRPGRKAVGSATVFAVLVVVVVAVSGAIAMLYPGLPGVGSSTEVNPMSTSRTVPTNYPGGVSTESASQSLGLKLTLSVNSTTIPSQDVIGVSASVQNTLTTANNLTASDDWAIDGLRSGPCDLGDSTDMLFSPVGVGIFRGTYGLNNITSAGSPLSVWAGISCVIDGVSVGGQYYPLGNITSYSLLPGSDNGTYAGYYVASYSPETLTMGVFPTRMVDQVTVYAANATGFSDYNSLLSSLPADYTLVAGDEWGQVALLHFSVVASNNLPKVGNFLANGKAGACTADGDPVPCVTSEFSQAFIFNCSAQAATASGCTTQVPSSFGAGYTITVWYPYAGPGEPAGDNCKFSVPGDTEPPYAHCFMVNNTAFAMSFAP